MPVGKREHHTEVTEVTEGDLRLVAKGLRVNSGDFVRETAETKNASHRGHGGHRGDLRLVAKGLRVTAGNLCEKQPKRREHRTEITEVTEVDLRLMAKGLS